MSNEWVINGKRTRPYDHFLMKENYWMLPSRQRRELQNFGLTQPLQTSTWDGQEAYITHEEPRNKIMTFNSTIIAKANQICVFRCRSDVWIGNRSIWEKLFCHIVTPKERHRKKITIKTKPKMEDSGGLCLILTFIFRGKFLHFGWQGFVKSLLTADEWFADCMVIIAHHAGVAAHLVNERLQGNPTTAPLPGAVLACLHSVRDTHGVGGPRGAGGMGSVAQAWRARGARGRLRAHAAAGRGWSQSAGHTQLSTDPGLKRAGKNP